MIFTLQELLEIMQKARRKEKEYVIAYREDDNLLILKANPDEEEFLFMNIPLYEYEKIGNTIYCRDIYANKWEISADEIYGFEFEEGEAEL